MGTIHRLRWSTALQACLDGEAGPSPTERVESHLDECEDCTAEMQALRRMKVALARLGGGTDPAVERLRTFAANVS